MKNSLKKVAIAVSMAASVGAIATAPAQAGSLTNATIGGTAASDYLVYDSNATQTFSVLKTQANVQKVLDGNALNPTGNVELRASTEQSTFNATEFSNNTTLTGNIGGKSLTLSSLTATDWFGTGLNKTYGAQTFATKWFNEFLTKAGKASFVGTTLGKTAFNAFLAIKGFERSSDPNISYVNQDDNNGLINIGLAGHYDLKAAYSQTGSPFAQLASLVKNGFQASEVVKYTYNGATDFLYSFEATKTGLTEISDGKSHSGNYAVSIQGVVQKTVPEPSALLGLLGVAGVFATQRKFNKLKKA
jgi:hypothetical protein